MFPAVELNEGDLSDSLLEARGIRAFPIFPMGVTTSGLIPNRKELPSSGADRSLGLVAQSGEPGGTEGLEERQDRCQQLHFTHKKMASLRVEGARQ